VGSKNKWEEANGAAVRERERKRATGHGFRGMGGGHARIFESAWRAAAFIRREPEAEERTFAFAACRIICAAIVWGATHDHFAVTQTCPNG